MAILRFMRCWAWPGTSWPRPGKICRARRLGPILLFSMTAGAISAFSSFALGYMGRPPSRWVPGCSSRICLAMVITRLTMPF